MTDTLPRLALSIGEPAGIGPDLVVLLAQHTYPAHLVAFTDPELMAARARRLGIGLELEVAARHAPGPQQAGRLKVVPLALHQPTVAGQLNPANSPYVLECLETACRACMEGHFDALVTGPVHKGIINAAGIPFSGHTEFLAAQTGTAQVVMMLATDTLRVALVTTHLPLSQVSAAITPQTLEQVVRILDRDLRRRFKLGAPRILVCGLNPHAGEDGHLGREELDIIIPVLDKLRAEGLHLDGPRPADTAFTPQALAHCDVVLSMYHDQGLPVLKAQGFGDAINITLGLPIVRTSVDHGTALDLAGTGKAKDSSLRRAVDVACALS